MGMPILGVGGKLYAVQKLIYALFNLVIGEQVVCHDSIQLSLYGVNEVQGCHWLLKDHGNFPDAYQTNPFLLCKKVILSPLECPSTTNCANASMHETSRKRGFMSSERN
jgi:hypothetical protein